MCTYKDADIQMNISTKSVEESNLFLRKLYDEISKSIKIGWQYYPYRDNCVIHVGDSSFGTMWLDYRVKGQINNIYISTKNMLMHNIVKAAVECAKENFQERKHYFISAKIMEMNFPFIAMCKDGIKIESRLSKENQYDNNIYFTIQAFGDFDLEYILNQKINFLQYLLCAYTNMCLTVKSCTIVGEKTVAFTEKDWGNYDTNWIDDCFVEVDGIRHIFLNPDFLKLFRMVLLNDQYEEKMRLILNAAQEIYCSKLLIDNYHNNPKLLIPGCIDVVNTMMISALEPLSNIDASKPETCKLCGNVKYKIRKKVIDLCTKHMGELMAKRIFDKQYNLRSSFLHEGNATTNEFYTGSSVPLINPALGNEMMATRADINYNLFDWVTYIFRREVADLFNKDENSI